MPSNNYDEKHRLSATVTERPIYGRVQILKRIARFRTMQLSPVFFAIGFLLVTFPTAAAAVFSVWAAVKLLQRR